MDEVDAPYLPMKQRRERPANSFQSELKQKMRDRKKLGLTADVTSEESEGLDDGLDSEEENSLTMNYRMQHKRTDRPTSAKRRGKPDLGETMRASDANKWLKSTQSKKDMTTLRKTPPLNESERFSKQPSKSEIDQMFGSSPRSQTSPLDKKLRQSPVEENLFAKGRTSPSSSSTSLPKSLFGGKKSPVPKERELTAEEKIFGRKTPTNDGQLPPQEKDWKAPSFRRSPFGDSDRMSPSADLDRRGGRKTPVDTGLQPITESPRPIPRSRQGSSPKETKLRSREGSPKSLSLESPKSDRPKPKVDIFGRKEKHVEIDDELEEKTPTKDRRRFQRTDKRTPAATSAVKQATTGRQTPTGRKTPTGKETPSGRQTPTGQQTPTSRFSKAVSREDKEKEETKKEPGLFDFLTDDTKDRPKPKSRHMEDKTTERKGMLKKSVSHDSISEEINTQTEQPSMFETSSKDEMFSKKLQSDQSSVCMELDRDPDKENARLKERERQLTSKDQRSDRKEADDIIACVENAQTDPKEIKDRPASSRTSKVLRPKPRHSLPGSRPSSASTQQSSETFNSTMSIRQAIFDEWRKTKTKEIKQKSEEQKKKEEEETKKKEKEKADKKLESLASFNAWMKQKEETFVKDKKQKQKEEEKKQKEKEREDLQKKKDALKNFQKWKENKDEKLIEEHKKKVEEAHRKEQEKKNEKADKEKQNETAFRGWKTKKDEKIKENLQHQQQEKMKTKKILEKTQVKKEQEALKEYNEWLKKKEEQEKREAHQRKLQKFKEEHEEIDFRPPWSPASKVIPCGR